MRAEGLLFSLVIGCPKNFLEDVDDHLTARLCGAVQRHCSGFTLRMCRWKSQAKVHHML